MNPKPPPPPRAPPGWFQTAGFSGFFMVLFGGIWATVGSVLTVVFTVVGGPLWDDWILDASSVQAAAQVLAVNPTNTRINNVNVMDIEFRFTDQLGERRVGHCGSTNRSLLASAQEGQPLTVEYDPGRPQRHRLRGESASVFGLFTLIPAAFAGVGWALAGWGLRRWWRRRTIAIHGPSALASVTAVEGTSSRVNRQRVYRVRVRFLGPRGMQDAVFDALQPPSAGSSVWILHDAEDPSQVVGG